MTTFDERERAFENRFAHDGDLLFRAQSRRDREVGLWAAHQLGRSGEDADGYAAEVLAAGVEGGPEAVVAKLAADFGRNGVHVTDHQIRRRMEEALAASVERLRQG